MTARHDARIDRSLSVTYIERDPGTVTLFNTGTNPSSFLWLDTTLPAAVIRLLHYIQLVRVNRMEAESITVQSTTPVPSDYLSAQWYGRFNASTASAGQEHTLMRPHRAITSPTACRQ